MLLPLVGAVLKPRRKDVVISTKVLQHSPAGAASSLDTSLKELGTDYVDPCYLHDIRCPDDLTPELIEVQQKAEQAGKIRFCGRERSLQSSRGAAGRHSAEQVGRSDG